MEALGNTSTLSLVLCFMRVVPLRISSIPRPRLGALLVELEDPPPTLWVSRKILSANLFTVCS